MSSHRRAPLFSISLAFAAGVILDLWASPPAGLVAFTGLAAVCWIFVRGPRLQTIVFYAVILLAAWLYSGLRTTALSPDDLRLQPEVRENPASQWHGVISTEPRERQDSVEFEFAVNRVSGPLFDRPATGTLAVSVRNGDSLSLRYGDALTLPGAPELPPEAQGPGQFDTRAWLARRDIYYRLQTSESAVIVGARGQGRWWMAQALEVRKWACRQLTLGLEDDRTVSAILAGMLFGYQESIPRPIEQDFRTTGTYHIFAVSGQNIAVLLAVAIVLLQGFGLIKWRYGWLCLPLLAGYALVSGLQSSVIRALLMAGLVLFAWRMGRPTSALNLWSAALLGVLIISPTGVQDIGFQLSFAVVLALILLTSRFQRVLYAPFTPDPFLPRSLFGPVRLFTDGALKALSLLIAGSIAAFCGSLPLMLWYFHQVSVVALVANLMVVPLAGLIVIVGSLSLFCAPFSTALTMIFNNTNWLFVKILLAIVAFFAAIPGAQRNAAPPPVWFSDQNPVIDVVGAGDSAVALVRHRGHAWLLNTGSARIYPYVLQPLLRYYGINRLDGTWITQPSASAFGAAVLLADEMPVRRWVAPPGRSPSSLYRIWLQDFAVRRLGREFPNIGNTLEISPGFTATVLGPGPGQERGQATDKGFVLWFRHANGNFLWAGNIGFGQEWEILKRFPDLRAEVLYQGRHPAESNLSREWLEALRPHWVLQPPENPFRAELPLHDPFRFLPEERKPSVIPLEKAGAVQLRFSSSGIQVIPFLDSKNP